ESCLPVAESVMMTSHSCWVLVEGAGLDVDAGTGARTQEVGGVVDADGEFAAIGHGVAGADVGGTFDDGRVDTAVDHAPRRVVVLTEFGMVIAPRSSDFQRRGQPTEAVSSCRTFSKRSMPLRWHDVG